MTLEMKLKRATLEITLRHQLRGARTDPGRAARNLVEACGVLSPVPLDEALRESLERQTLERLKADREGELLSWLEEVFRLE